jgi:Double-GTPase 2
MRTVALWGPSASGKTALLAQLYLRFPSAATAWRIFPTTKTQPFIEEMRSLMVDRSQFPLGTRIEQEKQIAYEFEHLKTRQRVLLFTEDRAGVVSERLDDSDVERFARADGLIILIDKTGRPNYESEILRALEHFYHSARSGGSSVDSRPLAFCLAKSDRFIKTAADLARTIHQPDEFVIERLPTDFIGWINQYCPNRRFFPISAVGVQGKFGAVRPTVFYDESMLLRLTNHGSPINLMVPFEWLFQQLEQKEGSA